jgi:hypothetical protein
MGELMSEYITLLQSHDWYYNYSDDFTFWQKGRNERDKLLQLRLELDQHALVWNQYAPTDFHIKG